MSTGLLRLVNRALKHDFSGFVDRNADKSMALSSFNNFANWFEEKVTVYPNYWIKTKNDIFKCICSTVIYRGKWNRFDNDMFTNQLVYKLLVDRNMNLETRWTIQMILILFVPFSSYVLNPRTGRYVLRG